MSGDNKTITIMLFRYDVPRVNITYKDKKDLFRTFKEELRKHRLSIGEVSWAEYDNTGFVRGAIRNADDLLEAVGNGDEVRIYCRPKDESLFTPPNSDDDGEIGEKNDLKKIATKSPEETKRVSLKLYRDNPPRITITYNDKKDLFKQFQKKIRGLNLPPGEVYSVDYHGNDRNIVGNADDLMRAVENNKRAESSTMKMYYRREGKNGLLSYQSSDED
ncbi:hypothetical protein Aduo_000627 [Ancylostoma duodenale]